MYDDEFDWGERPRMSRPLRTILCGAVVAVVVIAAALIIGVI